jgi:hypothetical protein
LVVSQTGVIHHSVVVDAQKAINPARERSNSM